MRRHRLLPFLASLLLLPACGAPRQAAGAASPAAPAPPIATDAAPAAEPPARAAYQQLAYPSAPPAPASASPSAPAGAARALPPHAPVNAAPAGSAPPDVSVRAPLVTYSGEIALRVTHEAASTIDAVLTTAESLGGYLASRRDDAVEIRIPSARFREAMTKIEPLGEVTHRSVAATDVSDEFHDAEVRLTNLRATRARLQELLGRAGSLTETLTVERELERVAAEMDRIEGRLEYLKSKVAFSSLVVSVDAHVKRADAVAAKGEKRTVDLPVKWLDELGTDRLLTLR